MLTILNLYGLDKTNIYIKKQVTCDAKRLAKIII
jgi:hypothetical protein